MATLKGMNLIKNCKIQSLNFSTSCFFNNKWRSQQGLEPHPRRFGPLTNLPDYSFVDGRPTPLSYLKKTKVEQQREFCKRIAELTHEMDVGLQKYYEKLEEQKRHREAILQNKLKPKGSALLKKNKHSKLS